jgi:hypothetical protein
MWNSWSWAWGLKLQFQPLPNWKALCRELVGLSKLNKGQKVHISILKGQEVKTEKQTGCRRLDKGATRPGHLEEGHHRWLSKAITETGSFRYRDRHSPKGCPPPWVTTQLAVSTGLGNDCYWRGQHSYLDSFF